MKGAGEILLVSCYELGRQPVAVASALARLEQAGYAPAAQDVAVEKLSEDRVRAARFVGISVPMHTALRLGVEVARRVRAWNPSARIAFFGLYAALNRDHLLERHADLALPSEEALVSALTGTEIERRTDPVPSRGGLPLLDRYARLDDGRVVASVEASKGCKHLCAHCPIVPVWQGRFVAVPRETVLADIGQQIEQGATHVTFGDPDFFNGPTHALRIVQEMRRRWPAVTWDATIKIEHLLAHRALLPQLEGCLFITSAVESLSDTVLLALRKGHTAADVPAAVGLVRTAGIDLRPTLLPYTPWTRLEDLPALFDFAEENDLVDQIDPVQFTLRLLIPRGSAILDTPEPRPWLRAFDPEAFGWHWEHPDPKVDALCRNSGSAVRAGAGFDELRALADAANGRPPHPARPLGPRKRAPRLTEPWFC